VEQDKLVREINPWGGKAFGIVETIYYRHVLLACDRRLSKGRLEVILRVTRSNCNNIPYIAPPFLQSAPNRHYFTVRRLWGLILEGVRRDIKEILVYCCILFIYLTPTLNFWKTLIRKKHDWRKDVKITRRFIGSLLKTCQ